MRARAELPLCFAFCGLALAQQPQSWTSHDQLSLTYYFYWYNAHTGQHMGDQPITRLTLHPPDSYLSTYSHTDVIFHKRELSDMAAAGIDVALPVYWGDPHNVAEWSVPGLQVMVQAEQAMAQAGQPAPKIGMFCDTTSLMTANNGVRPDLTTAAGKSLFYGMIHQFFTVVPRQFWAMIDGRPILVLYYAQPGNDQRDSRSHVLRDAWATWNPNPGGAFGRHCHDTGRRRRSNQRLALDRRGRSVSRHFQLQCRRQRSRRHHACGRDPR